jgi:hypothetical protein
MTDHLSLDCSTIGELSAALPPLRHARPLQHKVVDRRLIELTTAFAVHGDIVNSIMVLISTSAVAVPLVAYLLSLLITPLILQERRYSLTPLSIKHRSRAKSRPMVPTKTLRMQNDVSPLDQGEHARGAARHTNLSWGKLADHELRAWLLWIKWPRGFILNSMRCRLPTETR